MQILQFNRSLLHRIYIYLFMIFLLVFVYLKKDKISIILLPFIIGISISYILDPFVILLVKKGFKRTVAVSLIYFVLIASFIIGLVYILPVIVFELNNLINAIPEYTLKTEQLIKTLKLNYKEILPIGIQEAIDDTIYTLENKIIKLLQNVVNKIMWLFTRLFSMILGPVLGFYILKDIDKIRQNIITFLPAKNRQKFFYWFKKIDMTLGHYIRSQLIISCIISVLTTIALYILKVDFALIIGILAGVTNIIPYFGPIIGGLPAVFIALLKYPQKIVWIVLSILLIQEVESGIISPYIMGQSVGLHPITVVFALLTGGTFLGFWGLLLAVPIAALSKTLILNNFKNIS